MGCFFANLTTEQALPIYIFVLFLFGGGGLPGKGYRARASSFRTVARTKQIGCFIDICLMDFLDYIYIYAPTDLNWASSRVVAHTYMI